MASFLPFPVFVQDYLHFTAMQSGMLQMPGAIAAGVTMMAMGKLSGRYDARVLVGMGALVTVGTALMLSSINPNTGIDSLFWPLISRSLGSVMMFLPLSLATLGGLPRKIASGSGFYNLTRQLGSSIGIALITTLLAHREATHRAPLVERINLYRPGSRGAAERLCVARLAGTAADPVRIHKQAYAALDGIVSGQAALKSYADIFLYVGWRFHRCRCFFFSMPGQKQRQRRPPPIKAE